MLFGEMEELTGQRNAIDSRLVEIAAEIEGDGIWGATGCRSVRRWWPGRLGASPHNAETIVTAARRLEEFPRCAAMMREGQLSLDQVAVIAERAGTGSDAHYAQLAAVATVTQLRTAIKLEPRPKPDRKPEPERSVTQDRRRRRTPPIGSRCRSWRRRSSTPRWIRIVTRWSRRGNATTRRSPISMCEVFVGARHGENPEGPSVQVPPFPNAADAFMSLVEAGWDS